MLENVLGACSEAKEIVILGQPYYHYIKKMSKTTYINRKQMTLPE